MPKKIRKYMNFKFHNYKYLEMKLDKMAKKGLFLEKVGTLSWVFIKGEPKDMKYSITFFEEGSIFNPSLTDNQQTYIDFAQSSGWEFIDSFNQMQIFCTEQENTVPLETDHQQKFDNIKRCMNKTFIPGMVVCIVVFLFNLIVQLQNCISSPIRFFRDISTINSLLVMFTLVVYYSFILIDHFIWCKKSQKSIDLGGECIENRSSIRSFIDYFVLAFMFILVATMFLYLFKSTSIFYMLIVIMHIPIVALIYHISIKLNKKLKRTAKFNRIVSMTLLVFASIAYATFIIGFLLSNSTFIGGNKPIRVITDERYNENVEFEIYNDELLLTCEELYGAQYSDYSYEAEHENSFFMRTDEYIQQAPYWEKELPNLIYVVYRPKFNFVYDKVLSQLIEDNEIYKVVEFENNGLNTKKAYKFVSSNGEDRGEYILAYEDIIVSIILDDIPTEQEIEIISSVFYNI